MIHDIKHPTDWSELDQFHTFLWKKFPMDRFNFVEISGHESPEYVGTSLSLEEPLSQRVFCSDVNEAVNRYMSGACQKAA